MERTPFATAHDECMFIAFAAEGLSNHAVPGVSADWHSSCIMEISTRWGG